MTEREKLKLSDWHNKYFEVVGLFYAGFIIFGGVIGGVLAFFAKSGVSEFISNGWIYVLVGVGAGILTGRSLGLITNGILVVRRGVFNDEK